jgi:two-component system, NtrC family, sensor kinase
MNSFKNGSEALAEIEPQAASEVASGILRNVGKVLNNANITASLIAEKARSSSVAKLTGAISLMQSHKADLSHFLADDAKGRELPAQLCLLAVHMADEQAQILQEVAVLASDIKRIKEILAAQNDPGSLSSTIENGA